MKKALHIDTANLESISLDAPSIIVKIKGQSGLRFPIVRINRITVSGPWDAGLEVFSYCAERNIPVHLFDGRGRLRCQILPKERVPEPLFFYLEQLPYHDILKAVYDEWLLNQKRSILAEVGAGNGDPDFRATQLSESLRCMARTVNRKNEYHEMSDWMRAMFASQFSQLLLAFNIDCCRPETQQLVTDVTEAVEPILEAQALAAVHDNKKKVTAMLAAREYHDISERIEFLVNRMLNQLIWRMDANA
jgi:hypothetical protein